MQHIHQHFRVLHAFIIKVREENFDDKKNPIAISSEKRKVVAQLLRWCVGQVRCP